MNLRPQNCRWIGDFKHELSNIGVTVLADFVGQVLGGSYANAPVSGRSRTGGLRLVSTESLSNVESKKHLGIGRCLQDPSSIFVLICTHSQVRLIWLDQTVTSNQESVQDLPNLLSQLGHSEFKHMRMPCLTGSTHEPTILGCDMCRLHFS